MAKATDATEAPVTSEQTTEPSFIKRQPVQAVVETVTLDKPLVLPSDATPAVTGVDAQIEDVTKPLTQADIDKIIAARLKQERAKYADYEDLKAKVQAADDAQKTEAQKQAERLQALEAQNQALAKKNKEIATEAALVAAASDIGLDTVAAVKLADVSALADDLSNAAEIIKAVANAYPGLLRQRAGQTAAVNPSRSAQPPGRTDADRAREYFGAGGSNFWGGGGVRFTDQTE